MLKSSISDLQLPTCIYNASGPLCTTFDELCAINNSYSAIILTKSCTLYPRMGNEHPRYYYNDGHSTNSTGLANEGYEKYIEYANEFIKKPYFISVAGLSFNDNFEIIDSIIKSKNITGIELNLSCPNIIGKPQIGYDFEAVNYILGKIKELGIEDSDKIFGLKLPPYFDNSHFEQMSKIILKYPMIKFITCINSLGNGLIINNDSCVIKPNNGMGGIGGNIIKPFALSNVRKFYTLLENKVDIIGCGGITSGRDAYEHILCGAKMVQIGTQFMEEGVECFARIENELIEIMKEKGYKNLEQFRGKLQNI